MPLVALAFTYGSVGDVLETARLAKRIIDVLRTASGGSPERQRMISTLKDICDDVSTLTTLAVDVDLSSPGVCYFVTRLSVELALCSHGPMLRQNQRTRDSWPPVDGSVGREGISFMEGSNFGAALCSPPAIGGLEQVRAF